MHSNKNVNKITLISSPQCSETTFNNKSVVVESTSHTSVYEDLIHGKVSRGFPILWYERSKDNHP